MTKEQYEKWSKPFRKNSGAKLLTGADRAITAFIFLSYPALLFFLLWSGKLYQCVFCTMIPAGSFLLISAFRSWHSAPRPYEQLDIQPLMEKETKGKSFPSRHVFSVFIIGMTFFSVYQPAGVAIGVLGILLACIRVVGGVHFPKDVVAGALLGICFGLPCVFIL